MNSSTPATHSSAPAPAPRVNYRRVSPGAFAAMLALQQVVNQSGLEHSLLELVKLRASQINSCAYCLDLHWRAAKQAGETDERLYLLSAWAESPAYTPRERAALRWTEDLTRLSPGHVTDDTFAEARAHFSENELVQLTLAIVTINGWNRFSVGFKVPPRAAF
ncbi:MAG: carboxymuconolactone decarboxylase family protein [Opitutae bacterium]|nr:carboxymuconolactone decarboxylase family protein [Opitutae bacterium]